MIPGNDVVVAGEDLKPGDEIIIKDGKAFKSTLAKLPSGGGPQGEYEIINPSDKCYLTGAGEPLAGAGLFLGRGKYALRGKNGEEGLPLFLFGGIEDWWKATFGRSFDSYMDTKPHAAIADVLDTFRYAGERSSMNDIGKAAKANARALRAKAQEA
jgi:hypothetical protein